MKKGKASDTSPQVPNGLLKAFDKDDKNGEDLEITFNRSFKLKCTRVPSRGPLIPSELTATNLVIKPLSSKTEISIDMRYVMLTFTEGGTHHNTSRSYRLTRSQWLTLTMSLQTQLENRMEGFDQP